MALVWRTPNRGASGRGAQRRELGRLDGGLHDALDRAPSEGSAMRTSRSAVVCGRLRPVPHCRAPRRNTPCQTLKRPAHSLPLSARSSPGAPAPDRGLRNCGRCSTGGGFSRSTPHLGAVPDLGRLLCRLCWQVMRDLTHEPDAVVAAEASARCLGGLGRPAAWPAIPRGPLGRRHPARLDDHHRRTAGPQGPRRRSGRQDRPQGDRPGRGPHHLVHARRPAAILRGRDRAVHQRRHPGAGRQLRARASICCSDCSTSSRPRAAGTARRRPAPARRTTRRFAC